MTDSNLSRTNSRPTAGLYAAVLSCSLGLFMTGCSNGTDYRISLAEYVSLKQQLTQQRRAPSDSEVQAAQVLIDQQLGDYRVGPGDVLSIELSMLTDDAISTMQPLSVRIDDDGQILLPIVEELRVKGLTFKEVEHEIRGAFVPAVYRDVVAYATLVEPEPAKVLVRGAVTDPGFVNLRRTDRNMLHAIIGAGGVSEIASGKITLRRLRRPRQEVTLDLATPDGVRGALALDALEDGDMVFVQAATPNIVFVGGLVNAPSPQNFPPGAEVTVLQALAASGGLRTDVTPTEATLVHRLPHGEDVHVKLNLQRLEKGMDPNITLAAGDILWVPDTMLTRTQDFINRNIFMRAGVNLNYDIRAFEDLHSSFDSINQNQRDFAGVNVGPFTFGTSR